MRHNADDWYKSVRSVPLTAHPANLLPVLVHHGRPAHLGADHDGDQRRQRRPRKKESTRREFYETRPLRGGIIITQNTCVFLCLPSRTGTEATSR